MAPQSIGSHFKVRHFGQERALGKRLTARRTLHCNTNAESSQWLEGRGRARDYHAAITCFQGSDIAYVTALKPPSTTTIMPVTLLLPSIRLIAVSATSSAVTTRRSGVALARAFMSSS